MIDSHIGRGIDLEAPPEIIVHPKRQASARCPVCKVKFRAGGHKKKCRQDHRFRWFIYKIFHRTHKESGKVETRQSLADGKGITFPSGEDAIRYLKK